LDAIIPAWFDVLQHLLGSMFYNTCNSIENQPHHLLGKMIKRREAAAGSSMISRLHFAMPRKV